MNNLLLRCCQQQPKHCLWRKRENGCLVVLLSGCLVVLLSGCFVVLLFCCLVVLLFCCLEDNTERSESNPGRSLGIITEEKRAVWKTVPDNMLLRLRLCPHVLKKFTDNTDATDFIFSRI